MRGSKSAAAGVLAIAVIASGLYWSLTQDAWESIDCRVMDAGFIPLNGLRFFSVPKQNAFNTTPENRVNVAYLGNIVDGYNNLNVSEKLDTPCETTVYTILPTDQPIADAFGVPGSLETSQNIVKLDGSIGLSANFGVEGLGAGATVGVDLGAIREVSLSNTGLVRFDRSNARYLTRLLEEQPQTESLYVLDRLLVSDVIANESIGIGIEFETPGGKVKGKIGDKTQYKGVAVILGVKLLRLSASRWYESFRDNDRAINNQALIFIADYEKATKRSFDRKQDRFFAGRIDGDNVIFDFASPFTTAKTEILVNGEPKATGERLTLPLANGVWKAVFIAVSGRQLFAYRLVVSIDKNNPPSKIVEVSERESYAAMLTWEDVDLKNILTFKNLAEIDTKVMRLDKLTEEIMNQITLGAVQNSSGIEKFSATLANIEFDPLKKIRQEDLDEMGKLLAALKNQPVQPGQVKVIEVAATVHENLTSDIPITEEVVSATLADYKSLSTKAEFIVFRYAIGEIKRQDWEAAAESIKHTVAIAPPERRNRYTRLLTAVMYQHWQDLGDLSNCLRGEKSYRTCEDPEMGLDEAESKLRIVAVRLRRALLDMVPSGEFDVAQGRIVVGWNGETLHDGEAPQPWTETLYFPPAGLENVFGGEYRAEYLPDLNHAMLRTKKASFALHTRLDVDLTSFPWINFDWAAFTLPKEGDLRKDETDDQAIQVIIAFEDQYGIQHSLDYVWDTNAPIGETVSRNVGFGNSQYRLNYLVVASGSPDPGLEWRQIRRNMVDDIKQFVSEEIVPERLVAIFVQSNSQWSGGESDASIGPIVFSKEPVEETLH